MEIVEGLKINNNMAEVKILIQGYTSADNSAGEEKTCPTISLVRDKGAIIIIDPGVLEDQNILKKKLKEEDLTTDSVDFVFLTHSHLDHYRNAGMFARAKVIEYFGVWDGAKCDDWEEQFSEDIQIIKTPGHDYSSLTFLVKTEEGRVAICGDVFWKENYPEKDPYASDPVKLAESRKKVLEAADFVIPGHGPVFKVKNKFTN